MQSIHHFSFLILLICGLFFVTQPMAAVSVKEDKKGNIVYRNGDFIKEYKDITGEYGGILTKGKGLSDLALYYGDRTQMLFTLNKRKDGLYIDCVLVNDRSKINLVRVMRAVCGLGKPLTSDYLNIGWRYGNIWHEYIEHIDIYQPREEYFLDINLGNLRDIEIRDRYQTLEDLEGSTPKTYFKLANKCFSFPDGDIYIVYQKEDMKSIDSIFLELIVNRDSLFKKYSYETLKKMKYAECPIIK